MVYVIVLNWNGAADTIACAESVLALTGLQFQLVICDNASADDSVMRLRDWASGGGKGQLAASQETKAARFHPLLELENDTVLWRHSRLAPGTVVLIRTGANLGYAGGNNVGMRYALQRGDADFFWVLNNDTTVAPTALAALVAKANSDYNYGMVGSTLLYFSRPEHVQVLGGCRFSTWTTRVTPVGWGTTALEATELEESAVEAQLDYVAGASMLVSRAFVADVGLMQEDYFLYFEEIDWAERGRRSKTRRWKLGFARDSVVLHKVGASAGTGLTDASTRYMYTSKIRFMKRFYPARGVITAAMILMQAFKALLVNGSGTAQTIFSVLLSWRLIAAVTDSPTRENRR